MSGEVRQYGQQQSQRRPMRVRAGVITSTELADDAVTTAKIADDAVTTAKIPDGAVTEVKLSAAVQTKLNASEVEIVRSTSNYALADGGLDTLYVIINTGSNNIVVTPDTGTINGSATFTLEPGESISATFDSANWQLT